MKTLTLDDKKNVINQVEKNGLCAFVESANKEDYEGTSMYPVINNIQSRLESARDIFSGFQVEIVESINDK